MVLGDGLFCVYLAYISMEKKILSVQYLRGLAALGVVLCHYGSNLTPYPKLSVVFNFGQAGVHVFFLISGFIIVYSLIKADYKPQQFLKFLLKRSIRIDPTYIVTILLTLATFKILSFIPTFKGEGIPFIPAQFLAHLFYIIPFTKYTFYNHVFWTLCIEFQFYVLIGILYFLFESNIYKIGFLVLFSLTCLIPFTNSYYLVFNYAPIFSLGIALVSFYQKRNWSNCILPLIFLSLILYKFGWPILVLLVLSMLILFLVSAHIKPLAFLGQISYSLYLTHGLLFIVLVGMLKRLHFNPQQNQLLWLFVEMLFALLAASIFYFLIEKPSLKLSKLVFYKKPK